LRVRSAELRVPANCETPIAATLALEGEAGIGVACEFDFRHVGGECWDIDVHTGSGLLQLSQGGAVLRIDGQPQPLPAGTEYARVYDHFAQLVSAGASDVDVAPLRIVADALLCGRPVEVEPFFDDAGA
jgi:D-galactose 1-dehydrogenase